MSKKNTTREGKKRCARCGEWKPTKGWPRNGALAGGLAAYCRDCKRAADRGAPPAKRPISGASKAPSSGNPAAPELERRPVGRPSHLTPELIETICKPLRRGHTLKVACGRARVPESTFFEWLADGREPDCKGLKRDLFLAVAEAETDGEYEQVEIVREAAEIDPQYAKWLLERRRPNDWARREQLALVGDGGKPMEVSIVRELLSKRIDGLLAAPVDVVPPPPPAQAPEPGAEGGPPREPS